MQKGGKYGRKCKVKYIEGWGVGGGGGGDKAKRTPRRSDSNDWRKGLNREK
jgi:hypothetical protein